MNEPKVPDSDTDWQNIDIFLFSNGQHMTPPRKYHLGTTELNSWNSTLRTLAQSQYGSVLSIIDLYTIEGQRVFNPLEISNGLAYVAVPPGDTFISAGYSEYLLQASRSREKRQSKAKNGVQLELKDARDDEIQETVIDKQEGVENVETLNEETSNVATSTIGGQADQLFKVSPQYTTKNNNTIRQTGKNNANNINSAISRKPNPLTPQARKVSVKLKENLLRKNLKVNSTKNNSGSLITNSNNQSKTFSPMVKSRRNIEKDYLAKKFNERPKLDKKNEQQVAINEISPTNTLDSTLENVIDDNVLIVVKKQESDLRSPMFCDSDKSTNSAAARPTRFSSVVPLLMPIEESKLSSIIKDDLPVTSFNNLVENTYKPEQVVNDTTFTNRNTLQQNETIQEIHEDKIKLSKKPTIDSFIAVIDKGDVVNLNLKIEVRKCEGIITTQDSKPKNSISEKSSQVNLGHEIFETTPKRSNFANKLTVDEDNTKVVVIQCSCCENQNLNDILHKVDTAPVKLDDKKYVIILPDPQLYNSDERNERLQEENMSIATEKSAFLAGSSVITPVRKVYADTSVQRLAKKSQDIGILTSSVDCDPLKCDPRRPEIVTISRKMSSTQKLYQENSVMSVKNIHNTQVMFVDSSTQTEWHSMLLEARCDENGHYSFYLPPLQVLKHYGF